MSSTATRVLDPAQIDPQQVRAFYEQHPFPDYRPGDFAGFADIERRASDFARRLEQWLPAAGDVLEAGCGTGMLTVFLGRSARRRVVGLDFSAESLARGEQLRQRLHADNVRFHHADLFSPPFPQASFDAVLSLGVLHHTPAPEQGLRVLASLLKPGGVFVVGLYHAWGRSGHWRATAAASLLSREALPQASFYREGQAEAAAPETAESWYLDQYRHPGECGVTYRQARSWMRGAGLRCIGAVPDLGWDTSRLPRRDGGTELGAVRAWLLDCRMALQPVERGYFLLIGEKLRS